MINKRSIVITENMQIIFRHDNNNLNSNDNIELDILKALIRLNNNKKINIKKLDNMIRTYNNKLNILDIPDMIYDNENWKIL